MINIARIRFIVKTVSKRDTIMEFILTDEPLQCLKDLVSIQKDGLLPISQTSMLIHPHVAYHDYEGLALDHSERGKKLESGGGGEWYHRRRSLER